MNPERVAVVGAGTMGSGIAQTCAMSGLTVSLIDVSQEQLSRAQDWIRKSLSRLHAAGTLTAPLEDIANRVRTSTDLALASDAELVVEAVYESLQTKREVLQKLDRLVPSGTVLASNTSAISISALADSTSRPELVVGIHFMNPVPVMGVVELIRGARTSNGTYELARAFVARLGKTAIESKDVPGFIANRVLMPMLNEAILALEEGVGTADDIDAMMRGLNFPMGPLALADFIGLDVCLAIMEVMERDLGSSKYQPASLLRNHVAAGRLGRKSGSGFHDYR